MGQKQGNLSHIQQWLMAIFTLLLLVIINSQPADARRDNNPGGADTDHVQMPLKQYNEGLNRLESANTVRAPSRALLRLRQSVDGRFERGVFSGMVDSRLRVLSGHQRVQVPILGAGATVTSVTVNGQSASLQKQGQYYGLNIIEPGDYHVQVSFLQGQQNDRFERRLSLALPAGGVSAFAVAIPETGILPELTGGVIQANYKEAAETVLEGHLDATGRMELSWKRQLHSSESAQSSDLRMDGRMRTLFSLHEALAKGRSQVELSVRKGETDRVRLDIPTGVEITGVKGADVLQWQVERAGTETKDAGANSQLMVLLRHLVDSQTRFTIEFQSPVDIRQAVILQQPLLQGVDSLDGMLGVQGPSGLQVSVKNTEGLQAVELKDLPVELLDMSASPLLLGYQFNSTAQLHLALERYGTVELTSTVVDDLQASTVLLADGTEVSKVRLSVRNNTRQHIMARLPADALLTHALLDGRPIRPGVTEWDGHEALLLPLKQSERVQKGRGRRHLVGWADTLTGIANLYYGDASQWRLILDANRDQLGSVGLEIGQQLRIPPVAGGAVRERSFVLELAFKRQHSALQLLGQQDLQLLQLDVDTVNATWHVYTPDNVLALHFDANLTQYSRLRYDPLRRFLQFLGPALGIGDAWAGGKSRSEYDNILNQRQSIFREKTKRRQGGEEALGSFPLLGERYRFKRILLGQALPNMQISYISRDVIPAAQWLGLGLSGLLFWWLLKGQRRWRYLPIAIGVVGLLLVAHFVLGVHKRMVLGANLGMSLALFQLYGGACWQRLTAFWQGSSSWWQLLSWRWLVITSAGLVAIHIILSTPQMLALVLMGSLLLVWRIAK